MNTTTLIETTLRIFDSICQDSNAKADSKTKLETAFQLAQNLDEWANEIQPKNTLPKEIDATKELIFGKYKGKTPNEVLKTNPQYIEWLKGQGYIFINLSQDIPTPTEKGEDDDLPF